MIILRTILFFATLSIAWLQTPLAQSATYYISPTGSDSNPGTSEKPWLTFAYAIDSARASCGDTLVLKDGTYGDGAGTGKININKMSCTAGGELTIASQNQRQAKIFDNGTGKAISITNSTHITIDGIYARSSDNSGSTSNGYPFFITSSNHITIKNAVARNPNRYANTHVFNLQSVTDVLIEDSEAYVYHRHCVFGWKSTRVVARRVYCNTRGGQIPGGFKGTSGKIGSGDSAMAFYPCNSCIAENVIADGTTHGIYLTGLIASGGGISLKDNKILGSICYKCRHTNGIHIHPQKGTALINTPQNTLVRDVALPDFSSASSAIRTSDAINTMIDHVTVTGGEAGVTGIRADDNALGGEPTVNSVFITNSVVMGLSGLGFTVSGTNTWSGDEVVSHNNGIAFSPSLPSNWTNASTSNPELGTCKVWIPDGSPLKGAGTGGSDIGANILYRYVNGVLTSTPLWDPITGEFPHGAPDPDGTNRVLGQSLFDIHKRLNVNTGGCSFPKNYGSGDSGTKSPTSPNGLTVS